MASSLGCPTSTLALYRRAIELRGALPDTDALSWVPVGPEVVAFHRGEAFGCAVNTGGRAVAVTGVGTVLLETRTAAPAADPHVRLLPPDAAIWFVPA